MEIQSPETSRNEGVNGKSISMNTPQNRMDTGLSVQIVIPVVVGSSPISHPIKFKGFTR